MIVDKRTAGLDPHERNRLLQLLSGIGGAVACNKITLLCYRCNGPPASIAGFRTSRQQQAAAVAFGKGMAAEGVHSKSPKWVSRLPMTSKYDARRVFSSMAAVLLQTVCQRPLRKR